MTNRNEIPDWVMNVVEAASNACELGGYGHIGWGVMYGCDGWEVWVYPMRVEMRGGPNDGEELLPDNLYVRISDIADTFDEPPDLAWVHSWGQITEVNIEGKVGGIDVWLHIQEEPPEDAKASGVFDVNSGSFEEKRENA